MARIFSKKDDSFYYEVACRIDEMILAETVGEMPSQQELKEMYSFSPEFERKMKELINGIEERRIIPTAVKRIIVIAAIITALVLGALSASAIYKAVYNLYIACMGNYSVAAYSENSNHEMKHIDHIDVYYQPSFVPHGYVENRRSDLGSEYRIYYENSQYELIFAQSNIPTLKQIDTENANVIYFSIGDWVAQYVNKDEHILLFWEEHGYSFSIEGFVPLETAIYIAQSIEKIK